MTNANKFLKSFFSTNTFLGSFNEVNKIINIKLPECCFIGRSNVGKSSIINTITNNKKLAKTSKTPGRTQNINLFDISNKIIIADLPGYGFAKISKIKREELSILLENYLIERKNLLKIFILIDCKVGIKSSDIDTLDIISETNKKFSIILTKIDKCSLKFIKDQNQSISSLIKNYKKNFDTMLSASSNKKIGIIDIQKEIFNLSKTK